MRILEPAPNSHKKLPHRSKRRFALYGFILICVSLTFFFFMHKMKARQNVDAQNNHSNQDISDPVAQSNATSQDTVKDTLYVTSLIMSSGCFMITCVKRA
jgi:hypothetical protein